MDDDNSFTDGEPKDSTEPLSPKMGGKKLKLNDGSSQESSQEKGKIYPVTWRPWSTPTCSLEEIGKKFHTHSNC